MLEVQCTCKTVQRLDRETDGTDLGRTLLNLTESAIQMRLFGLDFRRLACKYKKNKDGK